MNKESITEALKRVKYPGYNRDIVSFGLIKNISAANGAVSVEIALTSPDQNVAQVIKTDCERIIKEQAGVLHVHVDVKVPAGTPAGPPPGQTSNPFESQNKVTGIRRIIAVASGKGGVGKSTVAVNLACALKHLGAEVGLLDCDIYGPSVPLMMGVQERPSLSKQEKMIPPMNHGIRLMSMGFLLDGDAPVIWRGPMIMKTIQQFITVVEWGDLDYLVVDLPPGTGDAQLSLCQTVPLDGGVIVTTPQEASLGVVRKGIAMFEKVNVPILGIVENMSYYTTPSGERVEIFGHSGGKKEAKRKGIPFLGEVPIFVETREGGDAGTPVVASDSESVFSKPFIEIAGSLISRFQPTA